MDLQVNNHSIYLILLITLVSSFVLVFLAKKIAKHVNAIDEPNYRKVHKIPIPRLGGLAIFGSFLIGYILYGEITTQMISILIGSFIIIMLGFIDDINSIPARYKFLVQTIAASIVVIYGQTYFNEISLLGLNFNFPTYINMGISILFIVAIINAINLIDGIDGLAAGMCSINFLTISIIALISSQLNGLDVILSVIMLGATLGFLVHNFPPASIFMGDSGSMFLGFMLSVISLLGFKMATITSLIVPLLILSIPILDTILAIFRRMLKGENIGTPDKEHIHHQLLKRFSAKKTILIIYVVNILFATVTILYCLGDAKQAIFIYIILMLFFIFLVLKTDVLFEHRKKKKVDHEK